MGQTTRGRPSRFIDEIPDNLLAQKIRPRRTSLMSEWTTRINQQRRPTGSTFRAGNKVTHTQFGKGIVLNSVGGGDEEMVTVAFESVGIKKLLVSFAGLEKM